MAKQTETKYGYLKDSRHLKKLGIEFLNAASAALRYQGYPNLEVTTDPETQETTWRWFHTSKKDDDCIVVRGWKEPLFFFEAQREGEVIPTFQQPWRKPEDNQGMSFTAYLLGWMGEVEFLKYRMDIQETLFTLKKMHPRGKMFRL